MCGRRQLLQSLGSLFTVALSFWCHVINLWPLLSTFSSPINAKKLNSLNSSDSYIGLWRNYLILCCSSASSSSSMCSSSSTSGSVRCSPPETLASTPDSGYSYDSKVKSTAADNSLFSHVTKSLIYKKCVSNLFLNAIQYQFRYDYMLYVTLNFKIKK